MVLKDHDLRQLDEKRIRDLKVRDPEALVNLSIRLLEDLKEARERLNQNPSNSSRPPSSQAPWFRAQEDEEDTEDPSDDEDREDPPEEATAQTWTPAGRPGIRAHAEADDHRPGGASPKHLCALRGGTGPRPGQSLYRF